MSLIRICEADDYIVDYDKAQGMYRISTFEDYHFQDEYWFDAYEEKEIKSLYFVYGNINESGDESTWVANVFDNLEQAIAYAEYSNMTKTQDNVEFYASDSVWIINKLDYVKKLEKLKGN